MPRKKKQPKNTNRDLVVAGNHQPAAIEPEVVRTNGHGHQEEIPGMPPQSELTTACNVFIEAEEVVHEKKKMQDLAAERIIKILNTERRSSVIVQCNDNRAYRFFTDQGKIRLKKVEVRSPSDKTAGERE